MAKKTRATIEWVGGLSSLPSYVMGEGKSYRPEVVLWVNVEGAVLGTAMGKPGEMLGAASQSLREAIERPLWGSPHAPERVRVASPELAAALRQEHPGLDIVCAATPELDSVLASMHKALGEDDEREPSYLTPDRGPEAVAAFFRAAAGLFRARPWATVPNDQDLLSITVEQLGVREAVVSVIGQLGKSLGLVVFSELDDFEAYLDAAEAMELGETPTMMPSHFALNFERRDELPEALHAEIATHRWEVAEPNASPWITAIDEDLVVRPLTASEATLAEAIALALPKVLAEKEALLAAWNGGPAVVRTVPVTAHAGELEVVVQVPPVRVRSRAAYDVLADLFELTQEDEIDDPHRRELEGELLDHFVASPEGKELPEVQFCSLILDFAAGHLGRTIATLTAANLRELLFEIIPRKLSVEASAARAIIDETRALYAFLKRECQLEQADACLQVLGGKAVERLEAALSDTSNFGMAKSLFMSGRQAGFALDSREGIEAWMPSIQGKPLPASVRLPSLGGAPRAGSTAASKAKKTQRKAARKARKKSR